MNSSADSWPFISVIIPALNEERHIVACLDSLIMGGYPTDRMEIIVADGGSEDGTREILASYQASHPMVRWIHNPGRLQAAGVNLAAKTARPESTYFVRVDAHALYPNGFLPTVIETARASEAALVVYVNEPQYETPFQHAVAYAFSHPLGVGDSRYRLGNYSGPVDHGQHGCFRRSSFEEVGGYDTSLVSNEDGELSWRIIQSGGLVYLDGNLRMKYFPRRSPGRLATQYLSYGMGRAQNCRKHNLVPRLRQLIPPLLVVGETAVLVAALFQPVLLLLLAPYYLALLLVTAAAIIKTRKISLSWLPVVFFIMHHSWGVGFLLGYDQGRKPRILVILPPQPSAATASLPGTEA